VTEFDDIRMVKERKGLISEYFMKQMYCLMTNSKTKMLSTKIFAELERIQLHQIITIHKCIAVIEVREVNVDSYSAIIITDMAQFKEGSHGFTCQLYVYPQME